MDDQREGRIGVSEIHRSEDGRWLFHYERDLSGEVMIEDDEPLGSAVHVPVSAILAWLSDASARLAALNPPEFTEEDATFLVKAIKLAHESGLQLPPEDEG